MGKSSAQYLFLLIGKGICTLAMHFRMHQLAAVDILGFQKLQDSGTGNRMIGPRGPKRRVRRRLLTRNRTGKEGGTMQARDRRRQFQAETGLLQRQLRCARHVARVFRWGFMGGLGIGSQGRRRRGGVKSRPDRQIVLDTVGIGWRHGQDLNWMCGWLWRSMSLLLLQGGA